MTPKSSREPRCVICGSRARVEAHHVGGRNHIAWFTCPLCGNHHDHFHVLLRQAGVELQYTPNPAERCTRVLKAILVFEWMVLEGLKSDMSQKGEDSNDPHA